MKNRINSAARANKQYHHHLTNRKLTKKRTLNVYRTYIAPILLYNCETWYNDYEIEKIFSFKINCFRKIVRDFYIPGKIRRTSDELYSIFDDFKRAEEIVEERTCSYLGYILRNKEAPPTTVLLAVT